MKADETNWRRRYEKDDKAPGCLVLEMAGKPGTGTDAGTVRCAQNRSTEPEGQFVLYYGISSHVGTAAARAYLTYADADGALHTVYSAVLRYTY